MPKLRDTIKEAEALLLLGPHPERASLDAQALLLHLLQKDRAWLLANRDLQIDSAAQASYSELVSRRQAGEPIQYITGQTEFFGLPFHVSPAVLIPRPETERLVEAAIRLVAPLAAPRIADIGTGAGIIAVSLAHALPMAQLTATDLNGDALVVAGNNARLAGVQDRITFIQGDLLSPLADKRYDLIASNPPYVPTPDLPALSTEVRHYEPHSALFAGPDGLSIYQRLIPQALDRLVEDGWLLLEIGYGQQPAVESLLIAYGYRNIHFLPDYQGIPRVAVAQQA